MNDVYRKNWIIHQLRRLSLKWPLRIKAVNRTKKTYFIKSSKGTDVKRVSFTCETCGKTDLKSSEKQLDHKIPVIDPQVGFVDYNTFIERLFCDEDNFKTICLLCHQKKSSTEGEQRMFNKKQKKKKQ